MPDRIVCVCMSVNNKKRSNKLIIIITTTESLISSSINIKKLSVLSNSLVFEFYRKNLVVKVFFTLPIIIIIIIVWIQSRCCYNFVLFFFTQQQQQLIEFNNFDNVDEWVFFFGYLSNIYLSITMRWKHQNGWCSCIYSVHLQFTNKQKKR